MAKIVRGKNLIVGGKADGKCIMDAAKKHGTTPSLIRKELTMGIEVEKEHTNDKAKAREIAMDHLMEDHLYYTRLAKMEGEAEAAKKRPIKLTREQAGDRMLGVFEDNLEEPFKSLDKGCDTPGKKVRSKGKGMCAAIGQGKGPGSHGGRVIGMDKKGNPVYESKRRAGGGSHRSTAKRLEQEWKDLELKHDMALSRAERSSTDQGYRSAKKQAQTYKVRANQAFRKMKTAQMKADEWEERQSYKSLDKEENVAMTSDEAIAKAIEEKGVMLGLDSIYGGNHLELQQELRKAENSKTSADKKATFGGQNQPKTVVDNNGDPTEEKGSKKKGEKKDKTNDSKTSADPDATFGGENQPKKKVSTIGGDGKNKSLEEGDMKKSVKAMRVVREVSEDLNKSLDVAEGVKVRKSRKPVKAKKQD